MAQELWEMDMEMGEESSPVPEGTYDLQCIAFESGQTKSGRNCFNAQYIIVGDLPDGVVNPRPIYEMFSLPQVSDPEKTKNFLMLNLKRALKAMDVPWESTGFNPVDCVNQECSVLVKQDEYTNEEGVTTIKNVIEWPRLPQDFNKAA